MNLTEAFDVALPDIPALAQRDVPPKMHPRLIAAEHMEAGVPVISVVISGRAEVYRLNRAQWGLIQMFDGTRTTYEQIATDFAAKYNMPTTAEEVRDVAETLAAGDFWDKSAVEHNVTLYRKLKDERGKKAKKKSRYGDLSRIQFPGWDPDRFFEIVYPYIKFMYTRWFTALTLLGFAVMFYIWIDHWGEYSRDTIKFFNFTDKGFRDIVEFYVLGCCVLFIHESAHGLTCKRLGGHVHDMGFHLIYLTPAFYVDATEAYVYGGRWDRIQVVVAGAWSELIICAIAAPIWVSTPPGSWGHELCYKLMLVTGVAVLFINWNPLIKLDGYFILSELLEVHDLKENSTAYMSAWVRKTIFRLPVEVPYVPPKRRPLFAAYAIASGTYSYFILFVFARIIGNMIRVAIPEWAFLGSTAVVFLMFRSRIRTFLRLMKIIYLDKKDKLRAWLTPARTAATGAAAIVILFAPVFHESVTAHFVLEPQRRVVLRAEVPGTVAGVYAEEGQRVAAGATIANLRNLKLEGEAAKAATDLRMAASRATQAQLGYGDYGRAEAEERSLAQRSRLLSDEIVMLAVTTPMAGTVTTPRMSDRVGSYLEAGAEIAEVADMSTMRARMFVPEFEMHKARMNARVRLHCDCSIDHLEGTVSAISTLSRAADAGVVELTSYKGIRPPNFYQYTILVNNPAGVLRSGMVGTGEIYGSRRSIAMFVLEPVWDFMSRKVW